MKIVVIIFLAIVIFLFGLVAGSKLMPETEFVTINAPPPAPSIPPPVRDLDHCIKAMELARETHQYYVDNDSGYYSQDAFRQEEWVRIYNNVIYNLELLRR